MKPLRFFLFAVSLAAHTLRAGVAEDFPDFFPKNAEPPPAENGYLLLKSLPEIPAWDSKVLPRIYPLEPDWLEKMDAAKVAGIVARNAALLEALEKVMSSPAMRSDSWKTFEPNDEGAFYAMRAVQGARLLMLRDIVAARETGSIKTAMDTIMRCNRFGLRICEAEPLLVDALIGRMICILGSRLLTTVAAMPQITPEMLQTAATHLAEMDRGKAVMRGAIPGEARWTLRMTAKLTESAPSRRDAIIELAILQHRVSEMGGKGSGVQESSPDEKLSDTIRRTWKTAMPENVSAALKAAEAIDWQAYAREQAEWFRALRKADTGSVTAFRASFHAVNPEQRLKGTPLESVFGFGEKTDEAYLRLCASTSSGVRLARVIILLRQYEIKHGKLPAALTDLVPEFCPSLLLDPYDGKPIRYDAPAKKVWCVGLNLGDEKGGNEPAKTDGADDEMLKLP